MYNQDTQSRISGQKRCVGTPVCYLIHDWSSRRFQPTYVSQLKTMAHISTKLNPAYTVSYIPNLTEVALAVSVIRVPETCQAFFIFFFFLFFYTKLICMHKQSSNVPISKNWYTSSAT